MSLLSQFGGGSTFVTSLVCGTQTIGTNADFAAQNANAQTALSGATTAATLKTAYSATGKGRINFFGVYTNDTTSRTIRIKVTVNGSSVIYDKTSGALAGARAGHSAIGAVSVNVSGSPVSFQPIDYTNGILIEFASSLTETDKLSTAINAEVRQ
jgi:hypothetical protein